MNSIQYNWEEKEFQYMGRYSDFTQDIINKYPSSRKEHTAICHRVSFYLMAKGLINALNFYICNMTSGTSVNQEELTRETMFYILSMILAVSGKHQDIFNDDFQIVEEYYSIGDSEIERYQFALMKMEEVMNAIGDEEQLFPMMLVVEGLVNCILDDLNNEPYNLQLGNASWNSSLGNAFDAFKLAELGEQGFVIGDEDSKVISILRHGTKGGGPDFNESELCIFTAEWKEEPFLYQSCSQKPLEKSNIIDCEIPILYRDLSDGEMHNFITDEIVEMKE